MTCSPDFDAFRARFEAGAAQLVWTRIVDDLETPVSAYLKLAHGEANAFLFESVEGGAWRGRYSVIAMRPELIWRCRGDQAEISEGEDLAAGRFQAQSGLVARSRMELPPGLPPMAGGVFGAIGYDMVRLVERLPHVNPDPLDLPDGLMIRPSLVAIFDSIGQEIVLTTTARPDGRSAREAYNAALARLAKVEADLRRPLPVRAPREPAPPGPDAPLPASSPAAPPGRMPPAPARAAPKGRSKVLAAVSAAQ